MNKLELLRTFARVTELSSFTQAGESLGLPRSSVSEQVQALEQLLGARLLQRTTRKVQATQDGLALYERSKALLAQMDELEGMFRQDGEVLAGRLRVDMPSRIARQVVMPHLGEFLDAHPGLELELSGTDRRVDLVREGFDCVLRAGNLLDETLVARALGAMPMVNCASPEYLARHGTPRTLDDLARHRLVHYLPVLGARPDGFEYLMGGKVHRVAMAGNLTVNNADAYEGACLGGLGLIQAPRMGLREHLASGALVELLPGYPAPPLALNLLYAHRHLPRRVRVFIDWLEGLLERERNR
ncbi:LysR family transcriptional regulator [Pseudomonas tohonis]|uniref:Transcriptional regulator n=1 Tax=Pseudomonas tohonis TaxID=2725477 RepID=A0A6J4E8Y3_9PSED|nr:LysR family transcriptional regulator [Pseudomonas tohonis]UXY51127.1 LysR family transcriptional regulator [Pseudomonas tohonis]BCG25819.1 transcriptional regulator [Pseudomonas tohonis]GJN56006.1 transcriptional regulator [Pseudomonas tohonis]